MAAKKVKRNPKVIAKIKKKMGVKKTPKGKAFDHKKPLADGGKDTPANIQLIPKKKHKIKTRNEAKARAKKKRK